MADRCLLCSASALAALVALASPAQAQYASYNIETATVVSGEVGINSTETTDTFTIFSPTAVIDLFALDFAQPGQPIQFQNPGTSAIYQGTTDSGDFVVLNRIVTETSGHPALFSGNVISRLDVDTGSPRPGGTVWFYSPGGIIVGDGAVFDVGNLLLSTADPTGGTGVIGSRTALNLASEPGSGAGITIAPGAVINAASPGSYVALVAPAVTQNGTVNVNGSAAYVAAESATLNFNQGLFDISVAVGSDAENGTPLLHGGTTRFLSTATPSRAYLVSVPKNDAATLVLGSGTDIGFDIATTVGVENGVIVLGSGFGNVSATPNPTQATGFANPASAAANISVSSGSFNANFIARARDTAEIVANGEAKFTNNVNLRGGTSASVSADEGTLTVSGNLAVDATTNSITSEVPQTGATAALSAINGGRVAIGGNLRVDASSRGAVMQTGATGRATGGTASITANDGSIAVTGNATAASTGFSATLGTGGTASVLVGSTFSVGGSLTLDVLGVGLAETPAIGTTSGGNAAGGIANLGVSAGGALQVGQNLIMSALAQGGDKVTSAPGNAGNAIGGAANLSVTGGTAAIGGATGITTRAQGGANPVTGNGGNAVGGVSTVQAAANGTLAFRTIDMNASALGGAGINGNGGDATGAANRVIATSGGQITASALNLNSIATGGAGLNGGRASVASPTDIQALNRGRIAVTGALSGATDAIGGTAANGGRGGDAVAAPIGVLGATGPGAQAQGGRIEAGSISLSASATGGAGGSGTTLGGRGGDATGAGTFVVAEAGNGVVQSGTTSLTARATGGAGGTASAPAGTGGRGGDATSGFGSVGTATGPDTSFSVGSGGFGNTTVTATSAGGSGGTGGGAGGAGGNATSLAANAFSNGAPATFGSLALSASASGGSGGTNTAGTRAAAGNAQAGQLNLMSQARAARPDRGSLVAGQISASALVSAGLGAASQQTGGTFAVRVVDGDLTASSITAQTTGVAPATPSSVTVGNGTLASGSGFSAAVVGDLRLSLYNGGVLSGNAVTINTPGTIAFLPRPAGATSDGIVNAPVIEFTSGDLDLGPTQLLGGAGTTSITLNTPRLDTPLTIGGTGQGPGYTLDQSEASRLRAGAIVIRQGAGQAVPTARVILRDLTLNGADGGAQANITSPTGGLLVTAAGSIQVTGNVRLNSAAAGNKLQFSLPGSFDLVTDTGSVGVFATGGGLGGQLSIGADDITVADQALFASADALGLGQFGSGTLDTARLSALLSAINKPSLVVKPEGSLQAGKIDLSASDFIVIQNSGTATVRGGFSVGAGGFFVTTVPRIGSPPPPLGLAINGRVLGADGIFLGDTATLGAITFIIQGNAADPLAIFNVASTVNGCPLTGSCLRSGEVDIIRVNQMVGDLIAELAAQTVEEILGARISPAIEAPSLLERSLISEPVTGSGNPSFWQTQATSSGDQK